MIYQDLAKNLRFDLIDSYCLRISTLNNDNQHIKKIYYYFSHLLHFPREGNPPLGFSAEIKKKFQPNYVIVRGNLLRVLSLLHAEDFISKAMFDKLFIVISRELICQMNELIPPEIKARTHETIINALKQHIQPLFRQGLAYNQKESII